jgi:hypothetical protein
MRAKKVRAEKSSVKRLSVKRLTARKLRVKKGWAGLTPRSSAGHFLAAGTVLHPMIVPEAPEAQRK